MPRKFKNNDVYLWGHCSDISDFVEVLHGLQRECLHKYSHAICAYECIEITEEGYKIGCVAEDSMDRRSTVFIGGTAKYVFHLPKDKIRALEIVSEIQ